MLALAATSADALVLSMTSARGAQRVQQLITRHDGPVVYLYHRVAGGSSGIRLLRREMARMGLGAVGRPPSAGELLGTNLETGEELVRDLGPYPPSWIPVLWPLGTVEHQRHLITRMRPGGSPLPHREQP